MKEPEIYSPREECGIFGVYGHPEAANLVFLGLYALQHRGQEGAGICSSQGDLYLEKGMGLVSEIFNDPKVLKSLPGTIAIGHNRYSTAGGSFLKNVQPIMANFSLGSIALAHNGNLTNADALRRLLEREGAIFQTNSDSEVILHLIANSRENTCINKLVDALSIIKGAYSLLILRNKEMIAIRDPFGVRPLSLGTLNGAYVVSSETCAFDLIGATYIRDIEPGEILIINENGLDSYRPFEVNKKAQCVFEFIYFSRPDSNIFGDLNVSLLRKRFGRQLAIESYVDADMVIPVPDSGVSSTLGFSDQSCIPFEFGLIRNHYVGRTFIEPKNNIRHFGVKVKLNPISKILKGKRVVVVDDSIVRGTTSKKIVKMIREIGNAKEVHMRISSPSTISPCFYGIDTPTRNELIASTHREDEIRKYITADSLAYLSLEGLRSTLPNPDDFCYACFDGVYPIEFQKAACSSKMLELTVV
ncbi:MAG: amidophosphoribosyltransferase [Candidatus Magnetoovum sp. WYHC-5]|nr:amidophosphoribosyltransferase [Candidatus Magnetoovum sp. WYHC-5]